MRTSHLHQVPGHALENGRDDAVKDEPNDAANDAANEDQLWIVDAGEGELRLTRGIGALRELIAERGLAKTARVYRLSATSKTLGDVAELQSAFETEPVPSPPQGELAAETACAEPPVRAAEPIAEVEVGPVEPASQTSEASQARDDEFALFDRPFDDGEYFADPPLSRWLRPAGMAALLVGLVAGGYGVFHARSVRRAPAEARQREAPTIAVAAPPTGEPAAVIPAVSPTPERREAAPAVAVADPVPAEPAIPAPAAQPAITPPGASSRSYRDLVAEGERQFQAGHSKKAQALFEQALVDTPEGTAALVGLAYVQLDRVRVPQAIALFQRALAQDRNDPTALFGLAESHRQEGNRSAALAEFQKFLTLRSTGRDADMARQLVQDLASGG